MTKQLRPQRQIDVKYFTPNGTDTINLPIGYDLETVSLYLSGVINVTTAYTGVKSEGLGWLIKRVDLMHNGETIATIPFTIASHGNFARCGSLVKANPGTAIGSYNVEVLAFIDQSHIGGMRPQDSCLFTEGSRQLSLKITWGAITDFMLGAGACTPAVPVISLQCMARETKHLGARTGLPELKRLHKFNEVPATVSKVEKIPLETSMSYRGIMLRCESNGDLSTAVLNSVRVMLGTDYIYDLPATFIQDTNTQDLDLTLPAGYYWIDFAPAPCGYAKVSDFLDTTGRADAFLLLDVNGGATNKVQYITHQFEVMHHHVAHNVHKTHPAVKGHPHAVEHK